METLKTIYSRHTTHKYNGKPAADDQLQKIVKAGQAAPIGGGRFEDVHMTVIRNEEFLNEWQEEAARQIGRPGIRPLYGAPCLILVSVKLTGTPADNPAYSNGACMVENMALAAVDQGLGATHIWGIVRALNQAPALLKKLNIPEGFTPVCGCAVGCIDDSYAIREIPDDKIATVWFD